MAKTKAQIQNRKWHKKWVRKHPDGDRENNLKKAGLSLAQYNELFRKQKGCCVICGKHQTEFKRALAVDHNHVTGRIRGLLCNSCNRGLGCFYSDEYGTELLCAAISYLKNNDNH